MEGVSMFGELIKMLSDEVGAVADDLRLGPGKRTITVAKPYCSPARHLVTGALQPYGVKIYSLTESIKTVGVKAALRQFGIDDSAFDNSERTTSPLPTAMVCRVVVNEQAAAWAEYLLLRTRKLYIVGDYVDPRNLAWATKHGGTMPPAWGDEPMIEVGCSKGMAAWGPLRKAAKKRRK